MIRILVTGATGFVGTYMVKLLKQSQYEVFSCTTSKVPFKDHHYLLDLTNETNVNKLIHEIRPTHIIHLAGQSSVGDSWKLKKRTIEVNLLGTINLLDAVLKYVPDCRLLSVGSSEEYGYVDKDSSSIDESFNTKPMSPYGVSKLSTGLICLQYAKAYSLNVVHARTFNHIGPGQNLGFVTQDFAEQIVQIENGEKDPIIYVGNLESIRDFTDVRDIVKAYQKLLFSESTGEIFNVCSGVGTKIFDILNMMIENSTTQISIKQDNNKMRPSDVPVLIGNNEKIKVATGWEPMVNIETSIVDILNNRRKKH